VSSEGGEYGGKSREYDKDSEETKEGTDESREDDEEYDSWDRKLARDIADELRDEEEAVEDARKLARELARELEGEEESKDAEEAEKEREVDDIFDDIEDARDKQHHDFVHDMHEDCPAKEAFSEEARRYYEEKEADEDVDSSEGEDAYSETGDGTMQVIKGDSESSASTEETSEASTPKPADESADESEVIEGPDATTEPEENKEDNGTAHHPDEVESPKPDAEQRTTEGNESANEPRYDKEDTSESKRQAHEQSSLDETSDWEIPDRASEDSKNESPERSKESGKSKEELHDDNAERSLDAEQSVPDQETTEDYDTTDSILGTEGAKERPKAENADDSAHDYEGTSQESTDHSTLNEVEESHEPDPDGTLESQLDDTNESEIEEEESDEYTLPPMLPEDLSFSIFPETEEERIERESRELWESLSEEERELIKPLLKRDIESEEDLRELLKIHHDASGFEHSQAEYEDALEFLDDSSDADAEVPVLIKRLQNLEAERRWIALVHSPESLTPSESENGLLREFIQWYLQHPEIDESPEVEENLRNVFFYFEIMEIVEKNPSVSIYRLSRDYEIGENMVRKWVKKGSKPWLLSQFLLWHRSRTRKKEVSRGSQVEFTEVYRSLRTVREESGRTIYTVAQALGRLLKQKMHLGVVTALLKSQKGHTPTWLKEILDYIRKNRMLIQNLLNSMIPDSESLRIRIAATESSLVFRLYDSEQIDYLSLLAREIFYFSEKDKRRIMSEACGAFGGITRSELSRIVNQLSTIGSLAARGRGGKNVHNINHDLLYETPFLYGETLRVILEIQNSSLNHIAPLVLRVGKANDAKGGIQQLPMSRGRLSLISRRLLKPQIPEGEDFLVLLARLYAIMVSDGSIDSSFRVDYGEKNKSRREYVKQLFSRLGSFSFKEIKDEKGAITGFCMPAVIGRLLVSLGLPKGDKVLQGPRIPRFVIDGSFAIRKAYIEEVIPEEGWVYVRKDRDTVEIGISRSRVLYEVKKRRETGDQNVISRRLAAFVRNNGERETTSFGAENRLSVFYVIRPKKLKELKGDKNKEIVRLAYELESMILRHPPDLLSDEKYLFGSIGIQMEYEAAKISFSEKTGRVSVEWRLRNSSQEDGARLGVIAPPIHVKKKERLLSWMKRHPELVQKALKQFKLVGMLE
jgi:hypothetical protein